MRDNSVIKRYLRYLVIPGLKKLFCPPSDIVSSFCNKQSYSCMIVYIYTVFVNKFFPKDSNFIENTHKRKNCREADFQILPPCSFFFYPFNYFITRTLRTPSIALSFSTTVSSTFLSTSITVYAYSFLLLFVIRRMFISSCASKDVNCPSIFGIL